MSAEPFASVVEAMRAPRIVRLADRLHAASFQLMKLLPAEFILSRAREEDRIGPGTTIVETTSGTFGLGLALACRGTGNALHLVSDPVIDDPLRARLEALGAVVDIVSRPAEVGGIQQARLDRVDELSATYPDTYVPTQYDNPDGPIAYGLAAERIAESLGRIDCLVGTVGSGGSMCGIGSFLRAAFPHLEMVGVDTPGSVLFGDTDGPRVLRGLGSSIHPRNLDVTMFDDVHWVSAAEAFHQTRVLHADHGLFMGPTSGAAYLVADWYRRTHPDRQVVVVLPDEGYRYQDTVHNPTWLSRQDLLLADGPIAPFEVEGPGDVPPGWTRLAWNRRALPTPATADAA